MNAQDGRIYADGLDVIIAPKRRGHSVTMGGPVATAQNAGTAKEIARRCQAHEPMLEALKKAAAQFAFYGEQHRQKGTPDGDAKAATNVDFAEMCNAAIALGTEGDAA